MTRMRMYTVVFQEVKTVGVITSIWFNKMLRDPICILPWPDAGMHVTLHYLNVKAHVFDNHTVFRVKRRNNENVHQLITLSVFFRIKKENNSDFRRRSVKFDLFQKYSRQKDNIQIKYNLR